MISVMCRSALMSCGGNFPIYGMQREAAEMDDAAKLERLLGYIDICIAEIERDLRCVDDTPYSGQLVLEILREVRRHGESDDK